MMITLSRQQAFEQSPMADWVIAGRQDYYFAQWQGADAADIARIAPYYDHCKTYIEHIHTPNGFCVLAYDAVISSQPYEAGFAPAVVQFLDMLGIEQVLLLQDLAYAWKEFGFDTEAQRKDFLQLLPDENSNCSLLLHHAGIAAVLPLLYHNNPDEGKCSLFTLSSNIQLGMLY